MPLDINLATNVLLHMTILFVFLGILFIVYISKIITQSFDNELTRSVDSTVTSTFASLDANHQQYIRSLMQNVPLDNFKQFYKKPDPTVAVNNSWLFTFIIVLCLVSILIMTVFLTTYKLSCNGDKLNLKVLLIENVAIFSLVGLIEFWFFINVAAKYIPFKPSFMKQTFIDQFRTHF